MSVDDAWRRQLMSTENEGNEHEEPRHERPQRVPAQPTSIDVWNSKYRLKTGKGEPVDEDMDATLARVATAIAEVEVDDDKRAHWAERFLWGLRNGAVPAGRIVANAGALKHKPATSTINCTVSGTIDDSMNAILGRAQEGGMTLKAGCGIGYEFSTLRPRGAYVTGAGSRTSGPLSFMEIYDRICFTVASAGGRRGAQMATFDVGHPDVLDFIRAKREDGRLRQFNLSLLITDEFVEAVKHGAQWALAFPVKRKIVEDEGIDVNDPKVVVWREWPDQKDYIVNDAGQVACRIVRTVRAQRIWDLIMSSTYDYAEPGFILIDAVNEMNNNWFCEQIRATNPCGEQPLPPYGACLLGSIDLTAFVHQPFTNEAWFDWQRYSEVVRVFTRLLDNVVEINALPLEQQRAEICEKRRHGMGYLGLGSALAMMRMRYGDARSLVFTEQATREMAITGWRESLALTREKGPAPVLTREFTITPRMMMIRPEMADDGISIGDEVPGRVLHARYSRYMQRIAEIEPDLVEALANEGARFTHHTSIAPTGTISLAMANNASNGIEPSFSHRYARNMIREGRKTKEKLEVLSYELLAYRMWVDPHATETTLPEYFASAEDITPAEHIAVQAAAQRWIDSSISKTANVPTDFPYEDFKSIYLEAHAQGLKGCTTFRFNPSAFQGVLVKESDLENTLYRFTLEDGTEVELKGNETVHYDGEDHTAANLHDALKEGYYGRL